MYWETEQIPGDNIHRVLGIITAQVAESVWSVFSLQTYLCVCVCVCVSANACASVLKAFMYLHSLQLWKLLLRLPQQSPFLRLPGDI